MEYCYRNTTEVYFTLDVIKRIHGYLKDNGFERVFMLTGRITSKEIAESIAENLTNSFKVFIYNGVSTNPTDSMVKDAYSNAVEFSPDVIITVGGGSVHDCGKAVSILLSNPESHNIDDFTVTGCLSVSGIKRVLPLITIPTLFGSGAEVSPAALLRIRNEKKVVFSPLLHPKATFVNVSFCKSSSSKVIARSAFDSFIQALEGYISSKANELSNVFALGVIGNFVSCVGNLSAGRIDDKVLEKLAVASILSSYVCSIASVGAIHALSNPLSGRFNIHHADALAMVSIEVLKYNLKATNAELTPLLNALEPLNVPLKDISIEDNIIEKIHFLVKVLGIGDYSVKFSINDIQEMIPECFNGDMMGNPYDFTEEELRDVLIKALMLNDEKSHDTNL